MILVHRLNNSEIMVNCDLIETIESTPDTTITFSNGKILIVRDDIDEICERIVEYKRSLYIKDYN